MFVLTPPSANAQYRFRWVACQIDHLCELPNDGARSKALDQLPRGLPETYDRILGRVLDRHEEIHRLVSMTLQWLVCAKYPLGRHALLEALSISPVETHLDPDTEATEDELLRWCSSLVRRRADGDGIELAHFTVKEYLTSTVFDNHGHGHENSRLAIFKIRPEESCKTLGILCLIYLNMSHLEVPPPGDLWDNAWHSSESEFCDEGSEGDESIEDDNPKTEDSNKTETIPGNKVDDNSPSRKEAATTALVTHQHERTDDERLGADEAFRPYLRTFPLLDYSANHWRSHLASHMNNRVDIRLSMTLFARQKSYRFIWWSYASMCDILQGELWHSPHSDTTTLHWAAMLSLPDLCSWLIDEGSDVNRTSQLGSPLDCALCGITSLYHGEQENYEALMDDDDQRRNKNTSGEEHCGTIYSVVKELIRRGAKLTATTYPYFQAQPLGLALMNYPWSDEVIQLLLREGALVTEGVLEIIDDYLTREGRSVSRTTIPSGIAVISSDSTVEYVPDNALPLYQRLLARLPDHASSATTLICNPFVEVKGTCPLDVLKARFLDAAKHGIFHTTMKFASEIGQLELGSIESIYGQGLTLALENGHQDVAEYLLKSGADPNCKDKCGDTPAHRVLQASAILSANYITRGIKALLDFGASLSICNHKGEQAIHLAAKSKHESLSKSIVAWIGERKFQQCLGTLTPSLLRYAVVGGTDSTVDFIILMYQEIDVVDHHSEDGTSLMGLAAMRETELALRFLYNKGLSVDVCSRDGSSEMFHAALNWRSDKPFKFLIAIGADDTSNRSDGRKRYTP